MSDLAAELAPADGWWNTSTEQAIRYAEAKLRAANVTGDVIRDVVERLIGAMREEYGE